MFVVRFVLPLLFFIALASAQPQATSDQQRIKKLEEQVKLEAALKQRPQAANVSVQEQIEALGAQRQAILRHRFEFLKTLQPTHPDVVYLNKKLAALEE